MAIMATFSGESVDCLPGDCGSIGDGGVSRGQDECKLYFSKIDIKNRSNVDLGDGGVGYGQDECKFHISKIVIIFLDLLMIWFSTSLDNFLGFVINSSSSCKNYASAQSRVLLTHNQFCLFNIFSTFCKKK